MKINISTKAPTQRKSQSASDVVTISFTASGDAKSMLPKLLVAIRRLGYVGASRTIRLVEGNMDTDKDLDFGFDGDGSDRIGDITVNGVTYEPQENQKETQD